MEKSKKKVKVMILFAAGIFLIAVMSVLAMKSRLLKIGSSTMYPVQKEGDIVWVLQKSEYQPGDILAFYHEDKVLVKRLIAMDNDKIDIHSDGTVFVNNRQLREPYLKEHSFGTTDLTFPYQIPLGELFVLNDQRFISTDSRNSAVGCVEKEAVIGKCMFCIWPIERIGVLR